MPPEPLATAGGGVEIRLAPGVLDDEVQVAGDELARRGRRSHVLWTELAAYVEPRRRFSR